MSGPAVNSLAGPAIGSGVVAQREAFNTEDGFVWHSNSAGGATYAGDGSSTYRYNPTGEDIVVTRSSLGEYNVNFGSTVNFLPTATAYGTPGTHCNIAGYSWPGNQVDLQCYDSAGNPADSRFSMRWTSTAEDAYTYVFSSGTPCCGTNPWGAAITVVNPAVGVYDVTVPGGPNFEGGHIQVTAWDQVQGAHCKVAYWGSATARINCYDSAGSLVDNGFTFLRVGSEDDAYAWADDAISTTAYDVSALYSHNPQATAPTSINNGTGSYTVTFPDLLRSYGGNVVVSAYGGGADTRCQVRNWGSTTVNVECFDTAGASVNSQFDVLYTRFQTCWGYPANVEIGNNAPTPGDDIIVGTAGNDTISALGGRDLVCGMGGIDNIYGGPGEDYLFGGDGLGNDTAFNNLYGGSNDDYLSGGPYDDYLYGQGGSDSLVTNNTASGLSDIMSGGSGNDVLTSNSQFGTDMRGNGNNDTLYGSPVGDIMRGDPGLDRIYGYGGADTIEGGNGADYLSGGNGSDTISGQGARDTLLGGAGDDFLYGGLGNDALDGGADTDFCDGQGQTGGAGDTAANCETAVGFPRVAPLILNFAPGRQILTEVQLTLIDRCDGTLSECLSQ